MDLRAQCVLSFAGLTMTININQHEYLKAAGDTAGAVVVIRPQNQMPFPEDDGIIVSPGHATSVAITQVVKKFSISQKNRTPFSLHIRKSSNRTGVHVIIQYF